MADVAMCCAICLPIAGVDSKWLERHQPIITSFISALQEQKTHASLDCGNDFYQVCGLRPLPNAIRLRILDTDIRHGLGGLGDIQAPGEQIAALKISPKIVFIVENLQTGLAFTDYPGAVVLMGLG